jgi:LysR family nitrogen assimilation transcriptional regulator
MEIGQLRTLIHVAELGSLSKAADRLRVAQPALSRQIRLLEDELGARLFDRHGRGMVITEAGREVLTHAVRVMAELEAIRSRVGDITASLSGRVAIGMPPTVAEILSVPLVQACRAAHPELDLRLVGAFTGYLLDWLQRGEIDLAVLYDPQPNRSLRSTPLLVENIFLIGPADSGLSLKRAVPFASLAGKPMLLPSPRHGLRSIVERCAAEAEISLSVTIEAESFSTLRDLVRHGHGLTILPLAPIHDDLEAGRLTAAPLIDPAPSRRLVLSYPSDRPVSRAARFAGETISTVAADMVERGLWSGQLVLAMPPGHS